MPQSNLASRAPPGSVQSIVRQRTQTEAFGRNSSKINSKEMKWIIKRT